jgi:hypothetical protein
MKYKHFIPHVNNPHLTRLALNSVKDELGENVVIIDNSEDLEIYNDKENWLPAKVRVPSQPLTTAQTMNWIRQMSIDENLDVFGFQHNDGEPPIETVKTLYDIAEKHVQINDRLGIVFGAYDIICIFSVKAVKEVGKWDWLYFPFYHLDNDYYERMKQMNYMIVSLELECKHHNDASSTIKTDERRKRYNDLHHPISEQLLREKWDDTRPPAWEGFQK